MPSTTLTLAGFVSVVVGISFLLVAPRVLAARISAENRLARNAHAMWWALLGTYLLIHGLLTISAGRDIDVKQAYFFSRIITVPLLCAAVWGISAYLLHLYTGNRGWAVGLAVAYVGVAALFYFVTYGEGPREVQVSPWVVGYDDSTPAYRLVYLLVGLPPIAASIAYLALIGRAQTRLQRYRILLGGSSILLYVGMGLLARLAAPDIVIFLTLVPVGAVAALAALLTQYPPSPWLQRLNMPAASSVGASGLDGNPRLRREAFMHRLRELI